MNRNIEIFDKRVAVLLDLNCAVVYNVVQERETEDKDGEQWALKAVWEWQKDMPYLSVNQIRRALRLLGEAGLVITADYENNAFVRTKWYKTNPVPERE